MSDIGENFCIAIDEIVTSRIEGLEFDITKICTVVDASEASGGKYIVSDGSIKFEAFSTITNYRKGNNVYVTIPKGNWNEKKIIIGKYVETNSTPFVYTAPLDTMVSFEDFNIQAQSNQLQLIANLKSSSPTFEIGSNYKIIKQGIIPPGYTRLGLQASFKTWLQAYEPISGMYGLKLILWSECDKQINDVANDDKYQFYELILDNINDMYGAPYNFEDYFLQEKVFDISSITNINGLNYQLIFFQNGNFKDLNGDIILPYQEFQNGKTELPANIFVKDIKIYVGYSIENFTKEELILYTINTSTYTNKENDLSANQKIINLRWIHKDSTTGKFRLVTLEELNKDNPDLIVKWYYYKHGAPAADEYSKPNWISIPNDYATLINHLSCQLNPNIQDIEQKIKAVGLYKIVDNNGNITYQPYTSSPATFENEDSVADDATYRLVTALSLQCLDESEGNYYIYNQNNELIDKGVGVGYQRRFKVLFNGAELYGVNHGNNVDKYTIDSITWLIPTSNTMIGLNKEYYNDVNSSQVKDDYEYRNKRYKSIKRNYKDLLNESDNTLNLEQSYYIKDYWSLNNSNNTVICILSKDKVEYVAELELNFGNSGTNGSNVTFVLSLYDEDDNRINALDLAKNNTGIIKPFLYDSNGQSLSLTGKTINWSWAQQDDDWEDPENMFLDTSINIPNSAAVYLNQNESISNNNYYIVKATLKNWIQTKIETDDDGNEEEKEKSKFDLVAYLPIPVKLNTNYLSLSGAKEIIYNTFGKAEYSKNPYQVYDIYNNKVNCNFYLNTDENNKYAPTLIKDINNNTTILQANAFYIDGANKRVCLYAKDENDKTIWAQPLLYYRNAYEFSMVNEWDGSLTFDNDNGTILSTMVGAGKKNIDNTFSGVLMGDIQTATENNLIKQTGVYGFQNGVNTFALKEDGTATFGAYNKGQIQIDGTRGIIKNAGYKEEYDWFQDTNIMSEGMKIDLDDGIFNVKSESGAEVLIQPTSPYLKVNSKNGNTLINIGVNDENKEEYFLQSDNYWDGDEDIPILGTKLSLTKGSFITASENSFIKIDPVGKACVHIKAQDNDILYIGGTTQDYYLQSINYGANSGMKIDLNESTIDGVDLCIHGHRNSNHFYLDASDWYYPFTIGERFKVRWDGTIECDGAIIKNAEIWTADIDNLTGAGANNCIQIGEFFNVNANGALTASRATIEGAISAGGLTAGGCTIGSDQISFNNGAYIHAYSDSGLIEIQNGLYVSSIRATTSVQLDTSDSKVAILTGDGLINLIPWTGVSPSNFAAAGHTHSYAAVNHTHLFSDIEWSSSRRYKNSINNLNTKLTLDDFQPVSFKYNQDFINDNNHTHYGFIAEDLDKINQDLVYYNENGQPEAIDLMSILTITVQEVQSLKKEIKELKTQLEIKE